MKIAGIEVNKIIGGCGQAVYLHLPDRTRIVVPYEQGWEKTAAVAIEQHKLIVAKKLLKHMEKMEEPEVALLIPETVTV